VKKQKHNLNQKGQNYEINGNLWETIQNLRTLSQKAVNIPVCLHIQTNF